MSGSLTVTLLTGGLELATAACILGKQILLSPQVPNYPMGSRRRRCGLFALGAILVYFGLETLTLGVAATRFSRPSGLVLMTAWCFVAETELETVMRQWLPVRLQRRVHQMWDYASCKSARDLRRRRELDAAAVLPGVVVVAPPAETVGPALIELELRGWDVAGPNESRGFLDR